MRKLKDLNELKIISQDLKRKGKRIGIISGCFEIIHADFIRLFRFAKKHVDILVIGLNSDRNVKLAKGDNRPVFNFLQRTKVLSELGTVDYIFKIEDIIEISPEEINRIYRKIYLAVKPDYIITNGKVDKYLADKKRAIEGSDIKILKISNNKQPILIDKIIGGR
ncbi:MAG TPA: adenylyltransferase/cytidyltransferase family protein [Candidatus Bathyarchaeia archaeon]|nr:adenylyltransferase/cytidyltransferase family protein [Candidatus Bathyarchaeia archaeon]